MMKLLRLLAAISILMNIACGNKNNSGLTVTVVPNRPVLIPYGSGTTVNNGYFKLTAPYFVISSLQVVWAGSGSLNIVAILVSSPTGGSSCGFGGDDIKQIFQSDINANGDVVLASGRTTTSFPFGCGGITVPQNTTTYNLPFNVQVVGAILDANNNTTGRAIATTNIIVQ